MSDLILAIEKRLLTIGVVLFLGASCLGADSLAALRRQASSGSYVEPGAEDLALAEELFAEAFSGTRSLSRLADLAARLRFEVVPVRERGEELFALREIESARRGRGIYVFRLRAPAPLAVEAPHSEDDLHSGALAEMMLLETRAAAAAWNTVRRDQPVEGRKDAADLAHLRDSVLHAFTRAFAAAHPKGVLVQLHGFSKGERKTAEGALADAILSCGGDSPPAWIRRAAVCLRERCGVKASVYPVDVLELGATTNTHARALERARHAGFLHVEISLEVRKRLKSSEDLRRGFWGCLPERQP